MQLPNIPWYRHWWGLAALLAGLFILVSFGFFAYLVYQNFSGIRGAVAPGRSGADPARLYGNPKSPWLGTSTPRLTIVEFSDFACPHCAATFPTVREIAARYPDSVKVIFRNFPVISEGSLDLALAGFCAADQGKFWIMHDRMFISRGVSDARSLADLARGAGLDATAFANCLADQRHLPAVQKDFEDGQALGVTGTPAWFFNGARVDGEVPRETFLRIVEELLQ